MAKFTIPSTQSMEKLKDFINQSEVYDINTGKKYTPSEIETCRTIYDEIFNGNKPSFNQSKVNEIFNKCGIGTKEEEGTDWRVKEGIRWRIK